METVTSLTLKIVLEMGQVKDRLPVDLVSVRSRARITWNPSCNDSFDSRERKTAKVKCKWNPKLHAGLEARRTL